MKLNDLKNGMKVELRIGEPNKTYYILDQKIFEIDETGIIDMFYGLKCYDEDLNHKTYSSSDIVTVYNANGIMLWTREKNKFMPQKGDIVYRKTTNKDGIKTLKESLFLKYEGNSYLIYDLISNVSVNVNYIAVPRKSNIVNIENTLHPFIKNEFNKILKPEEKYLIDDITESFSEYLIESLGVWLEDYAYEYKKEDYENEKLRRTKEAAINHKR